ncbi:MULTISPECIES: nuclease-related domain-containing protein [Oscillospiraceae]|uniref:Nuclease-like protein n=1 Tax=Harryflintia acetispora TaxID=1849041 RepID=A0A9X8Y7Z6_9FIRM|nr:MULTISPECIES: nuclease-related domain-containing protein [Oscillospiraceae]TCL42830.1 nuclease-like protein [Harryflintia acetispora]
MQQYGIWIVTGVLAVALLIGAWYLYRYLLYRSGKLGKQKVSAALKKFGVIRNFKVVDDLNLSYNGRAAHIDHMLIGFFGILFVSTVNDTAEYYGDAKSEGWTQVTAKTRKKMPNLMQENLHNIDVVREIFSKNDIYNIQMEGVTVFCGSVKKSLIGITGAQGLMTFKKFKAYLGKAKFDKDNDVDVPGLYGLIMKYKV